MPDIARIDQFLQRELSKQLLSEIAAVEAARWLDREGLLKDSLTRPGKPLRDLLRGGRIRGQHQEANGRWFITRTEVHVAVLSTSREAIHQSPPPMPNEQISNSEHLIRLAAARQKYQPSQIERLLIAESPPASADRFFYFEDVSKGDSLFWETMKVLYPDDYPLDEAPSRHRKREFLERFRDDGLFLLDAVEEPLGKISPALKRQRIRASLPKLFHNIKSVGGADSKVFLISASVFDVCAGPIASWGFNVMNDEMIDFPGSGCQRKFREKFRHALLK